MKLFGRKDQFEKNFDRDAWNFHRSESTRIINNAFTVSNEDFSGAANHIDNAISLALKGLESTRKKYYQNGGKYEARLAYLGVPWDEGNVNGIEGYLLMAKRAAERGNWIVAKRSLERVGAFYRRYRGWMLFTDKGFPAEDRAIYEVWKWVFSQSPNPSDAKYLKASKPNFANIGKDLCKTYILKYGPEKMKQFISNPRTQNDLWYSE